MDLASKVGAWAGRVGGWTPAERLAGAACVIAAAGLGALFWRLLPEWGANPDLSHGFLAPLVIALLWARARAEAPSSPGLSSRAQALLVALLAPLSLGAALLATVFAVATGWGGYPTLFLLGLSAGGAAAMACVLAAGREVRWISPGWVAFVLVVVVVLSAPLPPATQERLTLALREMVTIGVVEVLRLLGIPAFQSGNVIHLGAASVGVEDACSGVRSLVSCVLAGLVLSALLLRSRWRRVLLVGLAGPLAVLMNFFRSLTLTLLAKGGTDITGAWHDWLGFAVLGVTTALLAWLASSLEEDEFGGAPAAAVARSVLRGGRAAVAVGACAVAVLVVGGGWVGFVAAGTEARQTAAAVPALENLIPGEAGRGWSVETRSDLGLYVDALQTRHLLERSYQKRGEDGRVVRLTVYVAWWPAGATSVSTVANHTPEACWPGSGWRLAAEGNGRLSLPVGEGRVAADVEQRVFEYGGAAERVWFWHLVDGEPLRPFDPLRLREQVAMFFEHGVRREAEQAFVRISSNRDWSELAAEPLLREVLENLASIGLPLREAGGENR
jgi:exosortase